MPAEDETEAKILELCQERGPDKTICPSEAARALAGDDGDTQALMNEVRAAGRRLAWAGKIAVTQKGKPVDPDQAKGPIRFGLADD
ncbi:MAG: DUF3253 domain-containing protein [Geminicoccaceae bacterium]